MKCLRSLVTFETTLTGIAKIIFEDQAIWFSVLYFTSHQCSFILLKMQFFICMIYTHIYIYKVYMHAQIYTHRCVHKYVFVCVFIWLYVQHWVLTWYIAYFNYFFIYEINFSRISEIIYNILIVAQFIYLL